MQKLILILYKFNQQLVIGLFNIRFYLKFVSNFSFRIVEWILRILLNLVEE